MANELMAVQPKTMMIKNLCPGLAEVGKIKIGNKGHIRKTGEGKEWQAPQKLDHFLITTMERGSDNNYVVDERLHKHLSTNGEPLKSIPVRLIYDDISLNFATRYICYYGKTVFCSGDGETAQRLQPDRKTYKTIPCTCERQDPKFAGDDGKGKGKCKINGILSVIIDGADCVGGVWKFRTTSYNTVVGILSSLALISRITGGRLAGIPLNMTVSPKTVQDPIQGNQQTIYIVSLVYAGNMDTLRSTGYQIAMDEAKHGISMQQIEAQARQMIALTPSSGLGEESAAEIIEEFYPEEALEVMHTEVVRETPALVGAPEQKGITTVEIPPEAPKRERGKPSPGKARRTPAEVEEDKLADEADQRRQLEQEHHDATSPGCEHPNVAQDSNGNEVCTVCGEIIGGQEENPFPNLMETDTRDQQQYEDNPQPQQAQQQQVQDPNPPAIGDLF